MTHYARHVHAWHTAHAPKLGCYHTSNLCLHKRKELWLAVQFQRDTWISTMFNIWARNTDIYTTNGGKKKKNEKKSKRDHACRGSNSRPQTQSCTHAIWTGGLFSFFWEKTSHYTPHTARSGPKLGWYLTQRCPCSGNLELWQAVRFSKRCVWAKTTFSKNGECLVQRNVSKIKPGKSSYPLPAKT